MDVSRPFFALENPPQKVVQEGTSKLSEEESMLPMVFGNLAQKRDRIGIATPRRMRDPHHLRAVQKLPCLICERAPCHAHHIKFAQRFGLSIKVSDEFVVPLCSVHHDELHEV